MCCHTIYPPCSVLWHSLFTSTVSGPMTLLLSPTLLPEGHLLGKPVFPQSPSSQFPVYGDQCVTRAPDKLAGWCSHPPGTSMIPYHQKTRSIYTDSSSVTVGNDLFRETWRLDNSESFHKMNCNRQQVVNLSSRDFILRRQIPHFSPDVRIGYISALANISEHLLWLVIMLCVQSRKCNRSAIHGAHM